MWCWIETYMCKFNKTIFLFQIMQQGSVSRGASTTSYSQQQRQHSSSSTLERSHQHMLHEARGTAAYRQQHIMTNGGPDIVNERTPVSYRQDKIVYESDPRPGPVEPYRPPSVGLYTQLDIPPQPSVVENEPMPKPVDAKYGYHTEYISTSVRNLRENFRDRPDVAPEVQRTGRPWQQPDGIPWEPLPAGTTSGTAQNTVSSPVVPRKSCPPIVSFS